MQGPQVLKQGLRPLCARHTNYQIGARSGTMAIRASHNEFPGKWCPAVGGGSGVPSLSRISIHSSTISQISSNTALSSSPVATATEYHAWYISNVALVFFGPCYNPWHSGRCPSSPRLLYCVADISDLVRLCIPSLVSGNYYLRSGIWVNEFSVASPASNVLEPSPLLIGDYFSYLWRHVLMWRFLVLSFAS